MQLYFARHGESTANLLRVFSNRELDHPLTEKGCAQAYELAQKLAPEGISLLFTSPVPRARQTAALIGEKLGLLPEINPALREFDVGEFEGRADDGSWEKFWQLFDQWLVQRDLEARIPGGESYLEIRARFVSFVEELVRRYCQTDTRILLISHGGIYRLMLPLVLGNVPQVYADTHMLGNTEYVRAELTENGLRALEWAGQGLPGS